MCLCCVSIPVVLFIHFFFTLLLFRAVVCLFPPAASCVCCVSISAVLFIHFSVTAALVNFHLGSGRDITGTLETELEGEEL